MGVDPEIACGIVGNIGQLWLDGQFNDLQTHVGDILFNCNRYILCACSNFFKVLLKSEVKGECEHPIRQVSIRGISPEIFQLVLKAVYQGENGLSTENMVEFWHAVHQLEIPVLISKCETFLSSHLTLENFVNIYQNALLLKSRNVIKAAHHFVAKNFESFKQLDILILLQQPASCIEEIIGDDSLVGQSQNHVVEVILKWVSYELCVSETEPVNADSTVGDLSAQTSEVTGNNQDGVEVIFQNPHAVFDEDCTRHFSGQSLVRKQSLGTLLKLVTFTEVSKDSLKMLTDDDLVMGSKQSRDIIRQAMKLLNSAPTSITSTPATSTPATSTPATSTPATSSPATPTPATSTPATSTSVTYTPATSTSTTSTPATSTSTTSTPATSKGQPLVRKQSMGIFQILATFNEVSKNSLKMVADDDLVMSSNQRRNNVRQAMKLVNSAPTSVTSTPATSTPVTSTSATSTSVTYTPVTFTFATSTPATSKDTEDTVVFAICGNDYTIFAYSLYRGGIFQFLSTRYQISNIRTYHNKLLCRVLYSPKSTDPYWLSMTEFPFSGGMSTLGYIPNECVQVEDFCYTFKNDMYVYRRTPPYGNWFSLFALPKHMSSPSLAVPNDNILFYNSILNKEGKQEVYCFNTNSRRHWHMMTCTYKDCDFVTLIHNDHLYILYGNGVFVDVTNSVNFPAKAFSLPTRSEISANLLLWDFQFEIYGAVVHQDSLVVFGDLTSVLVSEILECKIPGLKAIKFVHLCDLVTKCHPLIIPKQLLLRQM